MGNEKRITGVMVKDYKDLQVEQERMKMSKSSCIPYSVFRIPQSGQALLFVFFLLLIVGILAGALAIMWQAEIKTRGSEKDGLIAFYLAQAGVEMGKAKLASDETWTGGGPYSFGAGTYTISVQNVACPGPYNTCKEIISTGRVNDAEREITVRVSLDSPPPGPPNTPGDERQLSSSWQEI